LTGTAAQYLVDAVKKNPREITVVALGPLTNLAQALLLDPSFASNVGEIVVLGGAFLSNGNVNPAAEANVRQLCRSEKPIMFLIIVCW
jgi:inosine-uridine nucleoside N-ribohydrolase